MIPYVYTFKQFSEIFSWFTPLECTNFWKFIDLAIMLYSLSFLLQIKWNHITRRSSLKVVAFLKWWWMWWKYITRNSNQESANTAKFVMGFHPLPLFNAPTPWPSFPPFLKSLFPLPSFLFHPLLRYFRQFRPLSCNLLLP